MVLYGVLGFWVLLEQYLSSSLDWKVLSIVFIYEMCKNEKIIKQYSSECYTLVQQNLIVLFLCDTCTVFLIRDKEFSVKCVI